MTTTPRRGLRDALRDREPTLLGMFLLLPRVEIIENIAASGFDVLVLDLEHGPYGAGDLLPLVAAAQGAGMFALVRTGHDDPAEIGRILDVGSDGILVPHVTSAAHAARI